MAAFISGLFSADGCVAEMKNKPACIEYSSASKQLLIDLYNMLKCFGIHCRITWMDKVSNRPQSKGQGNLNIYNLSNLRLFHKHIGFVLCPDKQEKLERAIKCERKQTKQHDKKKN